MAVSSRFLLCLQLLHLICSAYLVTAHETHWKSLRPDGRVLLNFGIPKPHDPFGFVCPILLIVLGNSLSDTGNYLRLFPDAPSGQYPYGITWPGYPTGRFSDGKLTVDIISLKLGLGYPTPYFSLNDTVNGTAAPDFRTSVNFAVAGATARNTPVLSPFFLQAQVDEAIAFANTARAGAAPYPVPPPEGFTKRGLYYIEVGGNDITFSLLAGVPLDVIANVIGPEVASNISLAVDRLYEEIGARQFLVWNIPPLGCATFIVTQFTNYPGAGEPDQAGCLPGINAVVQAVNGQIAAALQELRGRLPGANIILANVYSLIYDVSANPQNYGFTEPLRACCGSPTGPLNYNPDIFCGPDPALTPVCPNPSEYVYWDGIHFTQALYEVVARAILSGQILEPRVTLQQCAKDAKK